MSHKSAFQVTGILLSIVLLATGVPVQASQGPAISGHAQGGDNKPRIRIGAGDLLSISIFDVPELTQEVRVSDDGYATISLLGVVRMAGMKVADAQALLAREYQNRNLLRDPQVSITIKEYVTQNVSVLGEVNSPGAYSVLGARTLLDIVSEAHGITHSAAHRATIKRADGTVVHASLSPKAGALVDNVPVYPGDTVVIEKAGIVYVLGDVGRPGGFEMENEGRITLLEAISEAGGMNRSAALHSARIVRRDSTGVHQIPIGLKDFVDGRRADLPLQAEDIVYIPSSFLKRLIDRTPEMLQSAAMSANVYSVVPK